MNDAIPSLFTGRKVQSHIIHAGRLQFRSRACRTCAMKVRFVLPQVILGFCLLASTAGAGEASREAVAQGEALLWLSLVDSNKHDASWNEMSPAFKKEVSKRKWKSTVTDIRKPLGKVVSRKAKSAEYTKELAGAPEGEYVVAKFDTAFENKSAAVETVTLVLGTDLNWRVSSYFVK